MPIQEVTALKFDVVALRLQNLQMQIRAAAAPLENERDALLEVLRAEANAMPADRYDPNSRTFVPAAEPPSERSIRRSRAADMSTTAPDGVSVQ